MNKKTYRFNMVKGFINNNPMKKIIIFNYDFSKEISFDQFTYKFIVTSYCWKSTKKRSVHFISKSFKTLNQAIRYFVSLKISDNDIRQQLKVINSSNWNNL